MSGAPVGSYFSIKVGDQEQRYLIGTNVLSDRTIERLKTLLVSRRREKRREMMEDMGRYGRDLPKAAHEAFSQQLLADARSDLEITPEQAFSQLNAMDREALATLLLCAVDEIKSLEHALEVMDAYGDLEGLFAKIMEVASSVEEAAKNSSRRPAKASAK